MILTCPECSTKYLVASHAVGEEGRTVRCSKCAATWFQEPEEKENQEPEENFDPIPESVKPIPEGSSVPAIAENDNYGSIKGYTAAALIFIILVAPILFFAKDIVKSYPSTLLLYSTLGMDVSYPGEYLAFEHIETHIESDLDGKEMLAVSGKILNLSSSEKDIPEINAMLIDSNGNEIADWNFNAIDNIVPSESDIPFHTIYVDIPTNAVSVKFSFNNHL